MVDGHPLANHAAHACTHYMSAIDCACIQNSHRVVGHVRQSVRHVANWQSSDAAQRASQYGGGPVVEKRAEAYVPVVHADDPEATLHEPFNESLWPGCELHTQAVYEQDCGAGGVVWVGFEGVFVVDADTA
jgi:hypothetical protein